MTETCSTPDLTVRRRPLDTSAPVLAVESFLIHNGIDVFGDIVGVAGRPEDLADQGAQFVTTTTPGQIRGEIDHAR